MITGAVVVGAGEASSASELGVVEGWVTGGRVSRKTNVSLSMGS